MNPRQPLSVHLRERKMSRLITTLMLGCLALLLLASCNKEGKKNIDTSNVEQTAPSLTAVPAAEERGTTIDEEAAARLENLREDLHTEFVAMLPEFKYSYDEAADRMNGEGLPADGVEIPPLIDKLENRIKALTTPAGKTEQQQLIRVMLTQFQSAGMTAQSDATHAGDSGSQAGKPADKGGSGEATNDVGLKKAPKAYGEWRSIREEGENYTIEHNDDYYKQLLVYYDKDVIYSTFAKGQRIKNDTYDYKYDKGAGELLLTAKDGRYTMNLQCFVRDSEPGLMYVKQASGNVYTVYEKIGRGEEPWTEEENQRFLELQKEISGGGSGGNAKKGN